MEKTFTDYFLLDKDEAMMAYFTQLHKLSMLNPLELTLLTIYLAKRGHLDEAKAVADLLRRHEPEISITEKNKCFDCVLKLYELK